MAKKIVQNLYQIMDHSLYGLYIIILKMHVQESQWNLKEGQGKMDQSYYAGHLVMRAYAYSLMCNFQSDKRSKKCTPAALQAINRHVIHIVLAAVTAT